MLTLAFYGVVAVLLGCALFLVAALLLPAGEQIAPAIRDEPPWDLPESKRLGARDVADVRLPVALRGYRFAETDLLLDRLADELRERDREIGRLRAAASAPVVERPPDPGPETSARLPMPPDLPPAGRLPAERREPSDDPPTGPIPPVTEAWARWSPREPDAPRSSSAVRPGEPGSSGIRDD